MATATLDDVNKTLKDQNKSLGDLSYGFSEWFKLQQRERLDQLERDRENKKTAPSAPAPAFKQTDNSDGGGNPFGLLLNPAKLILPLVAGITAVGLAFAGLRGWELAVIKKVSEMKLIPNAISNGITRMRNSVFRMFGLTPEGLLTRDAQGRFTRAAPITTQISMRMNALRIRALRMFGLGADGKLIAVRDKDGLFKKNIVGRVTFQIGRLLKPLMAVSAGVGKWASGSGAKIMEFIRGFGGKAGGFVRIVGKILWPIGFLMSLFDGVKAYQESDADGSIAKLGDGIGGFLGSFIGAPFDLLKKGISWVIKKLFGVETNEDGSIPEGQGMAGWIVKQLESFSFEEAIKKLVSGVFGVIQGAVDWVKLLFTDPGEALSKLWTGLVGEGGLIDILMIPFNGAVNWAMEKFGWKDEDAPDFNLLQTIKDTWTTTTDKIKQGFVDFGNWLASIPAKIKLLAVQTIDTATPDWLIDMSDDIEAAKAAVAAFNVSAETPTAGQEAAAMTYQDAILREAQRAAAVANTVVDQSDNSTTDNSTTGVLNLGGDGSAMMSSDEIAAAGWAAEAQKYID
jgi:hypothetical protein